MAWNPSVVGSGAGARAMAANPWIGVASGVIGLASGAVKDSPAGPSNASSHPMTDLGVDFSNWTVATGGGNKVEGGSSGDFALPSWLILSGLVLGAIVATRWIAKKR